MIEAPAKKPSAQPSQYNWSAFQQQKMLDRNMSFKSPAPPPTPLNYGSLQDTGMPLPPVTTAAAIQSGTRAPETQRLSMKRYPEGDRTQSKIPTWLRYFASGGETLDPQERIDRNTQILVAHTKAAAKTFGQIADELRSFGCINAQFDHGKVTLKFDRSVSDKLDQFVTQHLPDMSHVRNFHYLEFTAGLANDAMLQVFAMPFFRLAPRMTMSRRLISIEEKAATRMGEQMAFLERMNSPAYRSGFVSEGTVAKLAERNVSQIRTDWVFPKKGGATINGRWYTEHALERMAPRTPEVMAELEVRFVARAKVKEETLSLKKFVDWFYENYPNPRGIPPSVVEAEIAKPGSTGIRVVLNENGDIVTAIPGGS